MNRARVVNLPSPLVHSRKSPPNALSSSTAGYRSRTKSWSSSESLQRGTLITPPSFLEQRDFAGLEVDKFRFGSELAVAAGPRAQLPRTRGRREPGGRQPAEWSETHHAWGSFCKPEMPYPRLTSSSEAVRTDRHFGTEAGKQNCLRLCSARPGSMIPHRGGQNPIRPTLRRSDLLVLKSAVLLHGPHPVNGHPERQAPSTITAR